MSTSPKVNKTRKTTVYYKVPPTPNVCHCCVQLLGLQTCKLGNTCYQIHSVSEFLSQQYQATAVPSYSDTLRIQSCGLKLTSCEPPCIPDHIPLSVYVEEDIVNIQRHLFTTTKRKLPVSRSFLLRKRKALQAHSKDPRLCDTPMLPLVTEIPEGEEVPPYRDIIS